MKPRNLLLLLRGKKEAPTDLRRLGLGLAVLLGLYFGMEYLGLWGLSDTSGKPIPYPPVINRWIGDFLRRRPLNLLCSRRRYPIMLATLFGGVLYEPA